MLHVASCRLFSTSNEQPVTSNKIEFFDILAIKEKLVRLYSRKVNKGAW